MCTVYPPKYIEMEYFEHLLKLRCSVKNKLWFLLVIKRHIFIIENKIETKEKSNNHIHTYHSDLTH